MKIQWLGHSCFYLTSQAGTRVLCDPFDPKIGYPAPAVEADIVTTSHKHSDHNYTQVVKGKFLQIDSPGRHVVDDVEITGFVTFHDEAGGKQRGQNLIFRILMDGICILHCGDLGHPLTPEQVKALGGVDVLLLPVGGYYTIDPAAATKVVQQLSPRMVIPMHYKTPAIDFPIQPVDAFLSLAGNAKKLGSTSMEIHLEDLSTGPAIVVLDYPT